MKRRLVRWAREVTPCRNARHEERGRCYPGGTDSHWTHLPYLDARMGTRSSSSWCQFWTTITLAARGESTTERRVGPDMAVPHAEVGGGDGRSR